MGIIGDKKQSGRPHSFWGGYKSRPESKSQYGGSTGHLDSIHPPGSGMRPAVSMPIVSLPVNDTPAAVAGKGKNRKSLPAAVPPSASSAQLVSRMVSIPPTNPQLRRLTLHCGLTRRH